MTTLETFKIILFYIIGGMSPTLLSYLYVKWKERQEERQRFGYIKKHWYGYVDHHAYERIDRSKKEDAFGLRLIVKENSLFEKLKYKLKYKLK